MASYSFNEEQIENRVKSDRCTRLVFCVIAAAAILVSCLLVYFRPAPAEYGSHLHIHWPVIVFVLFANPLARNIWNWRNRPQRVRKLLREASAFVSRDSVVACYPTNLQKSLALSEIVRFEEPSLGAGIYLRTSSRYRFLILQRFDGYEQLKAELAAAGIPFVKTVIPPNLEEFLGVITFSATAACALLSNSVRLLAANLFVSLLLSIGGFIVLNRSDLEKFGESRSRWMKAATLLPAIIAGVAFWANLS